MPKEILGIIFINLIIYLLIKFHLHSAYKSCDLQYEKHIIETKNPLLGIKPAMYPISDY